MLSVLIPTYNYNIVSLASELHKQCRDCGIVFEILVFDDCSSDKYSIKINKSINKLEYTTFRILPKNIGRSAIRNLLAKEAKYDWLLFLDADVLPKEQNFVIKYLNSITYKTQIVYGGILYTKDKPNTNQLLRWVYGHDREALPVIERNKNPYITFLTLNFLIKKEVFSSVCFNEDIPNLRHEDTLFSQHLKAKNINVEHIENPTYHLGLENSEAFLKKSLQSVDILYLFLKEGLISEHYTKITRVFFKLKKLGLNYMLILIYHMFNNSFRNNLLSDKPSLFIFDLYRLSYLCKLDFK